MLSSTSSSEARRETAAQGGLWPILLVLAICAGVVWIFEVFSAYAVPRLSSYVGRNVRERQEAITLRPGTERPTVLVAGTSLLLEGIDFPRFQEMLGDRWEVRRWVMEQTSFTDWHYGLRRIYAEGSRPDYVVLMMGPLNFARRPTVRGDYFARMMMLTGDFAEVSRELQLHPTEATNLLAANLSAFFGLKTELRKVLLIRLLPDLPKFTGMITRFDNRQRPPDQLFEVGAERLRTLQALAQAHGGQFILAIPPRPGKGPGSEILQAAGRREGVPVIVSIPQGELGLPYYRDANHLNPKGAAIYTDRFAPDLRRTLESLDAARRGAASPAAAAR
jgi:hypothetical protein